MSLIGDFQRGLMESEGSIENIGTVLAVQAFFNNF